MASCAIHHKNFQMAPHAHAVPVPSLHCIGTQPGAALAYSHWLCWSLIRMQMYLWSLNINHHRSQSCFFPSAGRWQRKHLMKIHNLFFCCEMTQTYHIRNKVALSYGFLEALIPIQIYVLSCEIIPDRSWSRYHLNSTRKVTTERFYPNTTCDFCEITKPEITATSLKFFWAASCAYTADW